MTTATEFSLEVRQERMNFDEALLEYLGKHHADRTDITFFWVMTNAIRYATKGRWKRTIALSENETTTVKEVIDNFGLVPFVESHPRAVTVWGESGHDDAFHAQYHDAPMHDGADTALFDTIPQVCETPRTKGQLE